MKKTLALFLTLILAALPLCAFAAVGDTATFTSSLTNIDYTAKGAFEVGDMAVAAVFWFDLVGLQGDATPLNLEVTTIDMTEVYVGLKGETTLLFAFRLGDETCLSTISSEEGSDSTFEVIGDDSLNLSEVVHSHECDDYLPLNRSTLVETLQTLSDYFNENS